jgi:tRNA 2-thiocytidine biosynthesis protein TtcA
VLAPVYNIFEEKRAILAGMGFIMKNSTNFKRLERRLQRLVGKAIENFRMIEDSDVVMVCLSGGKDSYSMLDILRALQSRAPVDFELIAVNLDQKQPGFPAHILPQYLSSIGAKFRIVDEDTYSIVKDKIPEGKTMCSLCSRLRRGILYRVATELGATKIALGHHREDILETFFLNLMFGGRLKAMPAKLRSDNGRHVVIRPLAYCAENDIERYARALQFPIIPCNLCGTQDNLQRQAIKSMLNEWERKAPGRKETLFQALSRVTPTHLMDPALFDFRSLAATVGTEVDTAGIDSDREFRISML